MKSSYKTKLSALALISFFLLAIASKPSKMAFQNSEVWIPNDFVPSKTILLVEKSGVSSKQEKKMEDYMAEKYPYKYEFVSSQTIINREGKYADVSLYKYALLVASHSHTRTDAQNRSLTTVGVDFHFYDRELGKHYPETGRGSSYAFTTFQPVINTIVKKFE